MKLWDGPQSATRRHGSIENKRLDGEQVSAHVVAQVYEAVGICSAEIPSRRDSQR